jgi:hypothetical protein
MKRKFMVSVVGTLLLAAGSGYAQQTQGNIAALEVQKVKSGMVSQYEAGRKQKAAWHKQQNDSQPLFVWEVLSGENTGSYIVGRLGQHWADMDKPTIPDEADKAEFQKVVGTAVDSLVTHYYEFLPKISRPESGNMPTKLAEILTFHARGGKESEFRAAAARINEAAQKTNWPAHYYWYSLASGGPTGVYVLVLPHANWADFEDRPEVKPYREMLKDAFGQTEADSVVHELDNSIEKVTTEIVQFRPDLSYLPGR